MKQRLEDFVRECHGRADAGHPESQYDLGILFSTGKGVALDYVTAHKWFNLAAAAGITEARELRADVASQMSKDEVAEALRAARQWLSARAPAPANVTELHPVSA
jgi:TPR repeat protein